MFATGAADRRVKLWEIREGFFEDFFEKKVE